MIATNIPQIKDVDWYRGHDIKTNKGINKAFPGAYIKFKPTDMASLGNGIQEGNVEFDIILLTDCLSDTDLRIDNQQDAAFDASFDDTFQAEQDHINLANLLHLYVSGFSGTVGDIAFYNALKDTDSDVEVINTIDRIRIDMLQDNGSIMKTTISFKGYAKDYMGNKAFSKVVTSLEIQQISM